MPSSSSLYFPPFRLDLDNQSLWREEQETVLKPKTFALLALLVQHAGRLVTKREILDAVWVEKSSSVAACWVGRGVCIEQYGMSEAYLPVLDALGCVSRGPESAMVVSLLRQHAPNWLLQLPGVCSPAERKTLLRQNQGITPRRMLRELTDALDVLVMTKPVVLLLKDLHWADAATLD